MRQFKPQAKRLKKKKKYSLRHLWNRTKSSNVHVIRIPGGEEKKKCEAEKVFKEIMSKKLPNFAKDIILQI